MLLEPTPGAGLVVGGGYYVLDRLADPLEAVTLVSAVGERAIVRGARGVEYAVATSLLSPVPADEFYRGLRRGAAPCASD